MNKTWWWELDTQGSEERTCASSESRLGTGTATVDEGLEFLHSPGSQTQTPHLSTPQMTPPGPNANRRTWDTQRPIKTTRPSRVLFLPAPRSVAHLGMRQEEQALWPQAGRGRTGPEGWLSHRLWCWPCLCALLSAGGHWTGYALSHPR